MISKNQKIFAIGIVAILAMSGIAALVLSPGGVSPGDENDADKLKVVTAFYPLRYMVETIGGDKVEVSSLLPDGTEGHDWSPTTSDILKAGKADLFIYIGAGMDDPWVENQVLPAIDTDKVTVVKSAEAVALSESTVKGTRFFVFDNDNDQTLVYDSSDAKVALGTTFEFDLDVFAAYSGYYDRAVEALNSAHYNLLFIPGADSVTVMNTGAHGDHYHAPSISATIPAGKPMHAAVSIDNKYVAFALDGENAVLVIDVNAPASYYKVADTAGSSTTNHATVVFDQNSLVYYADMSEIGDNQKNLMIINAKTGSKVLSGGYAGNAPEGGVYSSATGKVYFTCADGLSVVTSSGYMKTIPYAHEGDRLSRSWISDNGTWLISYVGSASQGLAYSSIVVYDLVNETLVAEMPVAVAQTASHGWPASMLLDDSRTVVITDPATGKVILVDVVDGAVREVDLEVEEPVSMRPVEDLNRHNLWVATGEGKLYLIDVNALRVETSMEMESSLGRNIVLSITSLVAEQGSNEPMYDPHTWISPHNARQQALTILNALVAEDPDNEDYYTERWEEFDEKLEDLDLRYKAELEGKTVDMVFVTHEAYGYLADRYGFNQKGIIGIYAEEQPSVSTLKALVASMIEHEVYVVYYDPTWTDKWAKTMKSSVESLSGHSVQMLKLYLLVGDVDGLDFLEQMEANLDSLKIGLGASG